MGYRWDMPIQTADGKRIPLKFITSTKDENEFYHELDQWVDRNLADWLKPVKMLSIPVPIDISSGPPMPVGPLTPTGVLGKYAASVKIRPGGLVYSDDITDFSTDGEGNMISNEWLSGCHHEWRVDTFFSATKYETCKKCGAKKEEL